MVHDETPTSLPTTHGVDWCLTPQGVASFGRSITTRNPFLNEGAKGDIAAEFEDDEELAIHIYKGGPSINWFAVYYQACMDRGGY